MKIETTMTQLGQVTVPAEVRRRLGLKRGDKVTFEIEDGRVTISPAEFTLETLAGSIPPLKKPLSDKEMSRIAKEEKVARDARLLAKW